MLRPSSQQYSEERYHALLQNIQDTVVTTDAHGRITFASPAMVDLLGWDPDEAVGVPVPDLVHPEDRGCAGRHDGACGGCRPSKGS